MRAIIKREIKNYLKNPIYWVGLLIVIVGVYQTLLPYLKIHYFNSNQEIAEISPVNLNDGDIMEGYIPSSPDQILELGLKEFERSMIEDMDMPEQEVIQIMDAINGMSIPQIVAYFEKNMGFMGAEYSFKRFEYYQGNSKDVNDYIEQKLQKHPYSYYFSHKFADFAGLFMSFFFTILLAFLFLRDTRKDTYELLHTKPIQAWQYILGKISGGFLAMVLTIGLLNVIFGGLCQIYGRMAGFPIRIGDLLLATCIYIIPNLLMIVCVYTMVALVFRNPLPAVPLMFLYIVYSNMGSIGPDGEYGYYGRTLAILVRFPGRFFDTDPPPMAIQNQISLLIISAFIAVLAIIIWKRRKIY